MHNFIATLLSVLSIIVAVVALNTVLMLGAPAYALILTILLSIPLGYFVYGLTKALLT